MFGRRRGGADRSLSNIYSLLAIVEGTPPLQKKIQIERKNVQEEKGRFIKMRDRGERKIKPKSVS